MLGGRGALRISTTNNEQAAEIVSSLSWVSKVRSEDGRLVIVAPAGRSTEISAVLSEKGIYISEMMQTQESLEDYYLEVTGEIASGEEQS